MIAMLIMLISGGVAGALMGSPENVLLAALVSYTVFTAWLTVRHRQPDIGILEYLALAHIVIIGLAALSINPEWEMVREPGVYTFDAIMALIFTVGDIRNILLKGMKRKHRLARHIWRISLSLVWAALALLTRSSRCSTQRSVKCLTWFSYLPVLFCALCSTGYQDLQMESDSAVLAAIYSRYRFL
jgi:hypothetical protein